MDSRLVDDFLHTFPDYRPSHASYVYGPANKDVVQLHVYGPVTRRGTCALDLISMTLEASYEATQPPTAYITDARLDSTGEELVLRDRHFVVDTTDPIVRLVLWLVLLVATIAWWL